MGGDRYKDFMRTFIFRNLPSILLGRPNQSEWHGPENVAQMGAEKCIQ